MPSASRMVSRHRCTFGRPAAALPPASKGLRPLQAWLDTIKGAEELGRAFKQEAAPH